MALLHKSTADPMLGVNLLTHNWNVQAATEEISNHELA
ncbi:hypothetical protein [Methylomonas fluvii]|nr:hypothetical protein [Methylomonas fluvii]